MSRGSPGGGLSAAVLIGAAAVPRPRAARVPPSHVICLERQHRSLREDRRQSAHRARLGGCVQVPEPQERGLLACLILSERPPTRSQLAYLLFCTGRPSATRAMAPPPCSQPRSACPAGQLADRWITGRRLRHVVAGPAATAVPVPRGWSYRGSR